MRNRLATIAACCLVPASVGAGDVGDILISIDGSGLELADVFASSIDASGSVGIIGTHEAFPDLPTDRGQAYLIDPATGAILRTLLTDPASFGSDPDAIRVAVGDGVAVIASPNEWVEPFTRQGAVYLFRVDDGALIARVVADNDDDDELYAGELTALEVGGGRVVVGAPEFGAGAVVVLDAQTGGELRRIDAPRELDGPTAEELWFGSAIHLVGHVAQRDGQPAHGAENIDALPVKRLALRRHDHQLDRHQSLFAFSRASSMVPTM